MTRFARILIAPLAIAAALVPAAAAEASPPVVPAMQVNEAQGSLVIPISAKCEGAKKCSYGVGTVSNSALTDVDYVAPEVTITTVKKNQTFTTQLVVPIVNDIQAEDAENFFVNILVVRGKKSAEFNFPQTIIPSDLPGFPF